MSPEGMQTRPMPDRVREAVLESIGSRWGTPGALPPVRVLDLFAGAGGAGLEALSRGATWCGFVERNKTTLRALRHNIRDLLGKNAPRATNLLRSDAFQPASWIFAMGHEPVDLVFVDPPFPDSRDTSPNAPVGRLLKAIDAAGILTEDAYVILRHEVRVDYDQQAYGGLNAIDVRRYSGMKVTFLAEADGAER